MNQLRKLFGLMATGAVVLALALTMQPPAPSRADLLMDFTGGGTPKKPPVTVVAGYTFTTTTTEDVSALAILENGTDPLSETHTVGVWDSTSSHNLLASVDISGTGTATYASTQGGRYVAQELSSTLVLAPGTYTIGATYSPSLSSTEQYFVGGPGAAIDPTFATGVTYDHANLNASGGGFAFPPQAEAPGDGYFGPNLVFGTVPVPEPPAWIGTTIGLAGLAGVRTWLRRRTTPRPA